MYIFINNSPCYSLGRCPIYPHFYPLKGGAMYLSEEAFTIDKGTVGVVPVVLLEIIRVQMCYIRLKHPELRLSDHTI